MLGESEEETDCNLCAPAYLRDGAGDGEENGGVLSLLGAVLFFFLFLLFILGAIAFLVSRFFPGLAQNLDLRDRKRESNSSISHGRPAPLGTHCDYCVVRSSLCPPGSQKRLISLTLCASVILTAILTELILCEIARCLPAHVRSVVTRATMLMLLVILVLVSPALEIHTIVSSFFLEDGNDRRTMREGKQKVMYILEGIFLLGWLVGYWSVGRVLSTGSHEESGAEHRPSLVEQYLKCTGVIGVCLMASLAGFAAVSSVWQTFGQREQPVRLVYIKLDTHGRSSSCPTQIPSAAKSDKKIILRRVLKSSARLPKLTSTVSNTVSTPPTRCWLPKKAAFGPLTTNN